MLSYQHAFHAGNHADILKHFVLTFVIEALNKKDKPYTLYDTHAGSGLYDLLDNRSTKTKEAENGILRLLKEESFPQEFNSYINFVKKYTEKNLYPGSPEFESELKRSIDKLFLSELHPAEIENLRNNMKHKENVQIYNRNGFEMLNALTPPLTKRGAVLIDPSYEEVSDYKEVTKAIINTNKKWSNGIIMLWYPLLAHRETEINIMIEQIILGARKTNANVEIVNAQLCVNSKDSHKEVALQDLDENNPPRLYGSGMLVINAPWHLKENCEILKMKAEACFNRKIDF